MKKKFAAVAAVVAGMLATTAPTLAQTASPALLQKVCDDAASQAVVGLENSKSGWSVDIRGQFASKATAFLSLWNSIGCGSDADARAALTQKYGNAFLPKAQP